ncbi:unnamed protein product [Heterobilharzia americana]|nr:unnamed protein product [Heterobilharzia americana]
MPMIGIENPAETVAGIFVGIWIVNFGCPSYVLTGRWRQCERGLLHTLTALLGCTRFRTTAHHPQANGMVERFHRQVKGPLSAANIPQWIEALPLVLLGIRNALKADARCISAELVYGTTLPSPTRCNEH